MILGGAAGKVHRWAEGIANKLTLQVMGLHKPFAAIFRAAEGNAKARVFRARNGVVLAAGGFIRNTTMMERHAPRYLKTLPIGGFGDDGAEIHLGCSVGGSSDYLDRISAWRFINPPYDWTKGLIIGASGDRITNEKQYGAHLSRAIYEMSDGRAWLVVDQAIWQKPLRKCALESCSHSSSSRSNRLRRGQSPPRRSPNRQACWACRQPH